MSMSVLLIKCSHSVHKTIQHLRHVRHMQLPTDNSCQVKHRASNIVNFLTLSFYIIIIITESVAINFKIFFLKY